MSRYPSDALWYRPLFMALPAMHRLRVEQRGLRQGLVQGGFGKPFAWLGLRLCLRLARFLPRLVRLALALPLPGFLALHFLLITRAVLAAIAVVAALAIALALALALPLRAALLELAWRARGFRLGLFRRGESFHGNTRDLAFDQLLDILEQFELFVVYQ